MNWLMVSWECIFVDDLDVDVGLLGPSARGRAPFARGIDGFAHLLEPKGGAVASDFAARFPPVGRARGDAEVEMIGDEIAGGVSRCHGRISFHTPASLREGVGRVLGNPPILFSDLF